MGAINKLGTVLAFSTLSLAMFGCSEQNNNTPTVKTITSAAQDNKSSLKLTPIDSLNISDYSLELCIKNTGRKYIEEISTLICNSKGIQYLDGLEQLTELKALYLNFNHISDINPLSKLINLETLYLSSNQVQDLEALSGLTKLVELAVQKNSIQDLSPLATLNTLKVLHTHSNRIYDFSVLNDLKLENISGKSQQES